MAEKEIVVLTGASGQQCAQLIPRLYNTPEATRFKLRLVVNSEGSRQRLQRDCPEAEVLAVDLLDVKGCEAALQNATTIYHIGATFHPHETQLGLNVVDAAVKETRRASTKFCHFVYSSVLSSQIDKLLNHQRKRLVEEYLIESGLNWTFLQPSHFMEPSIGVMVSQHAADEVVFSARFDPARKFTWMSLRDHGEASAKVILERERHYFASYPLTSTSPMPYTEFVRRVGEAMGKPTSIRRFTLEEATDSAAKFIWGGDADVDWRRTDGLHRLFWFYDQHGLVGNPNVLTWLLGHPPSTIEDAVKLGLEQQKR